MAEQRAAVSGHETASTCVSWVNVYVWPTFADGPGGRPLGPAPVSISSGAK